MSELSFLIELLLNHRLQKETKDAIALRIKEVEATGTPSRPVANMPRPVLGVAAQSPSTQAILDRNPDLAAVLAPPVPVEQVAQTPAAMAAMNSRNQAINESLSGKVDKVTGRPRKF